jgi:hypothetical protein
LHAEPNDDLTDLYALSQDDCFKREASSKSIGNLDIDAAAHEVVERRCTAETERYKTKRAEDFKGRTADFDRWSRQDDATDIKYVTELIAKIRNKVCHGFDC